MQSTLGDPETQARAREETAAGRRTLVALFPDMDLSTACEALGILGTNNLSMLAESADAKMVLLHSRKPSFLSRWDCSIKTGTRFVNWYIILTALLPRIIALLSLLSVSMGENEDMVNSQRLGLPCRLRFPGIFLRFLLVNSPHTTGYRKAI